MYSIKTEVELCFFIVLVDLKIKKKEIKNQFKREKDYNQIRFKKKESKKILINYSCISFNTKKCIFQK